MLKIPEITDADLVFPARAKEWMPPTDQIPNDIDHTWHQLAQHLFSKGGQDIGLVPKEDVDPEKAYRVIAATLGTFACKHEHKMAAVAYMLSEWFESCATREN